MGSIGSCKIIVFWYNLLVKHMLISCNVVCFAKKSILDLVRGNFVYFVDTTFGSAVKCSAVKCN